MKEWVKYQLSHKELTLPILTFPCTQLLNVTVNDLVHSSDLQAQGMYEIAKRCPMSASLSMMDLSVEAEAFGAEVKFSDHEVPTVTGALLTSIEDVEKMDVPTVGVKRTKTYLEGIKKAKELIKDRPVFAGVTGPFSLSGRLMDMTEIMVNCYVDPDFVHATLEKTTEFLINYIKAFKEMGADGVLLAEPAAGLLSPDLCDEFSTKYVKQIKEAVDDEKFIFIYHNCGNIVPLLDSILSINADCYHFGNAVDINEVLKIVGSDVVVMGNVDPVQQFNYGTKESMIKEVNMLLSKNSDYPNFVISSGCDIPATSNWDNINAYFEAVKENYEK